jgi:hypothetical protein
MGQGLIKRFTKDTARFKNELEIMKFIRKDFWTPVFKKQINNLRTARHQWFTLIILATPEAEIRRIAV